jgi:hypothetical protein
VQTIAAEGDTEFMLEFRLSSRLWYSETLGVLGGDADGKIDLANIRSMLEQSTKQKRSWWRRLIGQ